MRQIRVTNVSGEVVVRGGRTFPPYQSVTTMISKSGMCEVTACIHLRAEEVLEQTGVVPKVAFVLEPEPEPQAVEADPLACPHCDYVGKSERGLKAHIRQMHPEE